MTKPSFYLFAAVVFVSMLFIQTASASSVSVSFSGDKDVKPGHTYTLDYVVNMLNSRSFKISFKCSNANISGDTKVVFEKTDPYENTDVTKNGSLSISIKDSAKAGDIITVTASGKYTVANEMGVPDSWGDVSESYTLTVVSAEEPTPIPSATPTPEPVPVVSTDPTPLPAPEPANTSAPKASLHPVDKPKASVLPHSLSDMPSQIPPENPLPSMFPSTTPLLSVWDDLAAEMDKMEQGGLIDLSMTPSADPLPALMLEALKAKEGIIVINFNDYSCTIDSSQLGIIISEPVNLLMDMTKRTEVSNAADGQDIYQLHLAETGDLPGCLTYSIKALENKPGDTLYLYRYHGTSGLAEYRQSVTVDKNDVAAFEVYEGGSYFVTASLITDNPKTGESTEINNGPADNSVWFVIALISLVCAAAALYTVMHRNKHPKHYTTND